MNAKCRLRSNPTHIPFKVNSGINISMGDSEEMPDVFAPFSRVGSPIEVQWESLLFLSLNGYKRACVGELQRQLGEHNDTIPVESPLTIREQNIGISLPDILLKSTHRSGIVSRTQGKHGRQQKQQSDLSDIQSKYHLLIKDTCRGANSDRPRKKKTSILRACLPYPARAPARRRLAKGAAERPHEVAEITEARGETGFCDGKPVA